MPTKTSLFRKKYILELKEKQACSDKQGLNKFITGRLVLQNMMKEILQDEIKDAKQKHKSI